MKFISTSLTVAIFMCLSAYAQAQNADVRYAPSGNKDLAVVYTYDKKFDKNFFDFTLTDLEKIGFYLNDPHHNVNKVYEKEFGSTVLQTLSFNSLVMDEVVRPMLNIDPRMAAFTPFNLLMYRLKSDQKTVIAHLTPEAILDILEITNKEIRKNYIEAFKPLTSAIEKKFPAKKSTLKIKAYAEDTMMNFEIPFDEPDDIDDFMDEFQEKFEAVFENKGYIVAGYCNLKDSLNFDEDVLKMYTTFWSYDLCHIPFSYEIFDGDNAVPMAGIFAPCSMYLYVKEGENKIVIGMPTLKVWSAALGIKNKEQLKKIDELDIEIADILKGLGAREVPNGNPLLL